MLARLHRLVLIPLCAAVLFTACAPTTAIQGNIIRGPDLEGIRVGLDTRASVVARLGNPSTVSNFEDTTWYYIGQRTEQTAFFKPEVVEREIVVIEFGAGGQVANVAKLTLDDGEDIALVDRKTPTAGQSITVLQQLIGNIGRFQENFGDQ
ncbi:MAG: outer membrane protein assembly factor BamE [Alphaproteobacteria bacterium]|nr:outer membrane protein assembly factor BamE [Alphaproteobacteria bacterium]